MDTIILALRVMLSLAVVLGLLWVLQRRITRNARANGKAELVNIVTRQGISPKASVVVVDMDGKRFLLGVTEQSVNVLHAGEAPAPEAVPEPAQETANDDGAAGPIVDAASGPAEAFARSMASATGSHDDYRPQLHALPDGRRSGRRASRPAAEVVGNGPAGPLAGSILSPETWKQTAAALKQVRQR
jgi:flagellar protein FliO/FliZ